MNKVLKILMWTAACVFFVFLFAYVTMILWNWLVPSLFNGPVIHFWQALGLLALSKILFGFGGGGHCGGNHYRSKHWKNRYYEKMSMMTPEDRERFKAKMKEKWCYRDQNASAGKTDSSID
jgi:hypothetical protein